MENQFRKASHQRNQEVENILSELSGMLGDVKTPATFSSDHPIIYIMGCARSGTTVMCQFLANCTNFCYPSNFISRFYYNPYIGALLQYLMFDLDQKGELFGRLKQSGLSFSSELGKTTGALSPNEFWYYWRRYFVFNDVQKLASTDGLDGDGFLNGIRGIQHVFQSPIFLKGMILNWDIPFLASLSKNCFFVFVERNVAHNAYSLLEARKRYFGDIERWYSFKPPEYATIQNKSPFEQVVDQVRFTNAAIENGLNQISPDRYVRIKYEDFCENPDEFLISLGNLIKLDPNVFTKNLNSRASIVASNSVDAYNQDEWHRICHYVGAQAK